jgi:diacylglycerol kinase family enzyme
MLWTRSGAVPHQQARRVGFAAVRVLLIVNPTASSVNGRRRVAVERMLRTDPAIHLDVVDTTARGDAAHLARVAAGEGTDAVVVFAGDGTLNEAADGLAGTATALAPLPGGSTNVLARTLGVAYDPVRATERLLRSLREGSFRRVGLGAATPIGQQPRRFLFHLGLGFDAAVISRMERRPSVKRYAAHLAFAVTTVDTWLRHYDRGLHIRVEVPGAAGLVGEGPYAVVSNSDPYTYIGRRRVTLAPAAGLDRRLAVTVFSSLRASLLVRATASGAARARFVTSSAAIRQRGDVEQLVVSAEQPFPWQVDGDYVGDVDRLDINYEPEALTLVLP